jgi:predicted small lipoprotein YifL
MSQSRGIMCRTAALLFGIAGLLAACGVVGPPIPPEDVGVTPTITRQKLQHAHAEQKQEAAVAEETPQDAEPALQGPDVELPPLRPVGTR